MLRQLVINADDLGLTLGVNDGIFEAHDRGILTSASLLANAPATADALHRLRSHPSLGVGAHLALVDGTPTLPASQVPSLVQHDGRFHRSWKPFIVSCLRHEISLVDVERELTAQIERLLDSRITLTHLDAHKHVHGYPPVFAIVARLASRFRIGVVRVPYEGWTAAANATADGSWTVRRQKWLNAAMWPWARRNYRTAASLRLRIPHFSGRIHTGALDRSVFRDIVRHLRPGVTELMVHPGRVDAALEQTETRLLESRNRERALLCSLEARAVLAGERVQPVRHDLGHCTRRFFRHVS
jgi:predicted glycoside hydrolase/deacetylase ChbG (UPF0249 family)